MDSCYFLSCLPPTLGAEKSRHCQSLPTARAQALYLGLTKQMHLLVTLNWALVT